LSTIGGRTLHVSQHNGEPFFLSQARQTEVQPGATFIFAVATARCDNQGAQEPAATLRASFPAEPSPLELPARASNVPNADITLCDDGYINVSTVGSSKSMVLAPPGPTTTTAGTTQESATTTTASPPAVDGAGALLTPPKTPTIKPFDT